MELIQNQDTSTFGFGLYTNKSSYEIWEMKQEIRYQHEAQAQMAMEAQMAMGGMGGGPEIPDTPFEQPPPNMPMALPNGPQQQQGQKPPREDEAVGTNVQV